MSKTLYLSYHETAMMSIQRSAMERIIGGLQSRLLLITQHPSHLNFLSEPSLVA